MTRWRINLIRSLENANKALEEAKVSVGFEQTREFKRRDTLLDYLESTSSPQPDHERAFLALSVLLKDSIPSTELVRKLDELLAAEPSLIGRRSELFVGQEENYKLSVCRRVFMAHGDMQSGAEEWYRLQSGQRTAGMYLANFAQLALASAGVLKDYS